MNQWLQRAKREIRQRTAAWAVLVYLLIISGAMLALPVTTIAWMRLPFLGAFVEPTGLFSNAGPAGGQEWVGKSLGLGLDTRLLAINAEPVTSPRVVRQVLAQHFPGEEVRLLVEREGGVKETLVLTLQPFPVPDRWAYFYIPYLVGLVYLASGIFVFLVRRYSRSGRIFSWFAASAAFSIAGVLDIFAVHRFDGLWSFTLPMSGAALLSLALHFPRVPVPLRRFTRLPYGFAALGALLGGYNLWALTLAQDPRAYIYAWRVSYIFVGLAGLVFLASLLYHRLRSPSPLERDQVAFVLVTALVAFGPLAVWLVAPLLGWALPFSPWLVVLTGLFPIGTGYALMRYRVVRMDYLLQQGVLYALMLVATLVAYGLLVSGASLVLGAVLDVRGPLGMGLLFFLLALLLDPLRQGLRHAIDLLFARREALYAQRLEAFGESLTLLVEEADVWHLLRTYVMEDLDPWPLHLFVYDPVSGVYQATPDAQGEPTSDLRFAAESPFLQWLAEQGHARYLVDPEELPAAAREELMRVALLHAVLFVPLPGRQQRLVGFLALGMRRNGRRYSGADLDYLEALARQTALALERAQVVGVLERRVSELNTLARVAQGVNFAPTFDDLLELIYAQSTRLIPATLMHITLWDPRYEALVYAIYVHQEERLSAVENQPLPENQGLVYEVYREGRPLRVDDYERACRMRGLLPEEEGLFAWMGVPLIVGTERIGVLALGHHDPVVAYTSEQQGILQAIADQAAGAIVKARLLRESERRARQLALLNEVARSLTSTLDLEVLLKRLLESTLELLECEAASLFLVDPATGELVFEHALGPVGERLKGVRLPPGTGLVGQAVETRQPILVADARTDPRWSDDLDRETGFTTRSVLVVPLVAQERSIGALEVLNKRDGSRFTDEDAQLLMALAGQAAVAIENARLYAQTDQALAARVEELSVLQRIDRELSTSLDLGRTMRITLDWAIRRSGSRGGFIGQVDEEKDLVHIIAVEGMERGILPYQRQGVPLNEFPLLAQAVRTGRPQHWCVQDGGEGRTFLKEGQAQIVLPLRHEAATVGVLVLESTAPQGYDEETRHFLVRLVDHASVAVANARLYAALQEANRAKSDFISFVAHELKTPMTSIRGYTDLMLAGAVGPINETQENFLRTIRANVERMAALVSDLADISRIEAGQLRLEFRQVDLREVVDEVVRSLQQQIEAKQQTLEVRLPDSLPPVWGDRIRLAQVLTNLVSNAHKYTPEGGQIRVWAEVTANHWDLEGAPEVVHVAVQDTGLGIHPDEQPRIFQRFFRSEVDREAHEAPGTGLGLYITKTLVEMQGGRIWFESEYRKGTTFHFTIPVATAVEMAPEASSREE